MGIGAWGRAILWFVAGVVIAGMAWLGLRQWALSGQATLHSYEVRPEMAAELRSALGSALAGSKDAPVGRVSLAPDGHHLLVSAPRAVQFGVAEAIRQANDSPAAPTPPAVTFDLWLVSALPGAAVNDPALADIQPALATIEKSRGAAHFQLLERLSSMARSGGTFSTVRGANVQLRVQSPVIHRSGDSKLTVSADIDVMLLPSARFPASGSMDASVELTPGNLLVIGQRSLSADSGAKDAQLYYIMRATI